MAEEENIQIQPKPLLGKKSRKEYQAQYYQQRKDKHNDEQTDTVSEPDAVYPRNVSKATNSSLFVLNA